MRVGLEELLEHDPVVDVLAGRDPDRGDGPGDRGVAEDVVGAGRLLDPVRIERRQPAHPVDRLADVPALVGIDGQHQLGPDLLADDPDPAQVVLDVRADLHLEPGPALGQRLATQPADLVVVVAEPADRGRVGGVTVPQQLRLGARPSWGRGAPAAASASSAVRASVRCSGSRRARRSRPVSSRRAAPTAAGPPLFAYEVPDGVDHRGGGQVDDALLRPDPAQLAVADERSRQNAPMSAKSVVGRAADDERPEGVGRRPRRPPCRARS